MNKLSLTSTFAISTCFLLTSCATPEQKAAQEVARQAAFATAVAESEEKIPDGYSRLTGEALVEFVSDSTISGLSQSSPGWRYDVYRAPDGTQRGTSTNGSSTSKDSGKWTMNGDTYCSEWNKWVEGKKECFHLYTGSTNDYYSMTTEGKFWSSKEFRVTRVVGNTKNL